MNIKQNHYSAAFENGTINVNEQSYCVSSDSDVEPNGHCEKATKRRVAYESNIATEQGLIELGKHMAIQENAKQKRATKYLYFTTSVKELDDFNGEKFLKEVSNCKDKNLVMGKIQSLVGYVSMFKELYNHRVEDISVLDKEIESLKVENADVGEMVGMYIDEIDVGEAKLKKVVTEVTRYKKISAAYEKKLAEYISLINQHKKTNLILITDNQIYNGNERIHRDEKSDWVYQKVSLDKIVLMQKKTIAQLKKNATYDQCSTRKCAYFIIGCGTMVVGFAMYLMTYGNLPLCALIGLFKH
jgi:hypothetical protein